MLEASRIKSLATEVGFDLCGITTAGFLDGEESHLREWLEAGCHGTLGYMERNIDKRLDVSTLVDGARSVIVCALHYPRVRYNATATDKIASFACIPDYHKTVKEKLHQMLVQLGVSGRAFVDSAPLLEKQLAINAGLGWRGRQSLLITPEFGPWVVLGELVVTEVVDMYDEPFGPSRCGQCRACVQACPAGGRALIQDSVLDVRHCVSYLTQQGSGNSENLHGWKWGCDECLNACPYGK